MLQADGQIPYQMDIPTNETLNDQTIEFATNCDPNKHHNTSQKNRKFCDNARTNNFMTNLQSHTEVTLQQSVNNDRFDNDVALSHKNVKKVSKLNKNAPIFEPKINQQRKLSTISEDDALSPVPSMSSVSSLITQSSISSNTFSINSSSSYSYSSAITNTANINKNTQTMTSGFIQPYNGTIFPATPNIAANTNYLAPTYIPAPYMPIPACLMPMFPIQPIPNAQFNQSTVISSCISNQFGTAEPRDDINAQCNNNTIHQICDLTLHTVDEEKKTFEPKLNNHAKGNFYISQILVLRMMSECLEQFETDHVNDEKLAFGYYKESVAIQINDKQINIISTQKGSIIIINIDLHFCRTGNIMYLVATENDIQFRHKVRWKIVDLMHEDQLYDEYRISSHQLPKSSRNMNWFTWSMNNSPINISKHIINGTNFKNKPERISKRAKSSSLSRTRISEKELKKECYRSWNNKIMIPVIVIKGKKQWIEWKKLIRINNKQWIGISLRYYPSNQQWKIECMDYDIGRIFYQHRLCGLNQNDEHNYSYTHLCQYNMTALHIY